MAAHKHVALIKAKADNMELVVFLNSGPEWFETSLTTMVANDDLDFFLCLPQHKEACLHWLNGGEVEKQTESTGKNNWCKIVEYGLTKGWHHSSEFMMINVSARIKPRKEKRAIGVNAKTGQTTNAYKIDEEGNYAVDEVRLNYGMSDNWQFIEIEVEV